VTRARKELIAVEDTPFYHCISRCVRRAYLCGEDYQSGQNFDHRKVWLVERIKFLSSVFAIDVCAYAVMSNHYHLVLFINQDAVNSWSQEEVLERWGQLFPTSAHKLQTLLAAAESEVVRKSYAEKIEEWRGQLADISWFMRCLNETVARMANKEDGCKGRFWEGRFKSQALLDEKALLSCMAYVDLNPIRAKMARTPEGSDFTSIQERLFDHAKRVRRPSRQQQNLVRQFKKNVVDQRDSDLKQARLKPLNGSCFAPLSEGIPFTRQDYFELVDWTGRALREDKRGAIDSKLPPILQRLGIQSENWIDSVSHFQKYFFDAAGTTSSLEQFRERKNRQRSEQGNRVEPAGWIKGKGASKKLYG
jgi:REP element-mobilizing transposase RayT